MPPDKLLSCPFCGSNNKRPVVQKTLCVRPYIVMCFQCFAQTSEYNTEEEAMFAWNTRTPSPELVELRKDKERLDWLQKGHSIVGLAPNEATGNTRFSANFHEQNWSEHDVRTAIDVAKEKK